MARSATGPRPLLAMVLGLIAGAVVVGLLLAVGWPANDEPVAKDFRFRGSPEAAARFLETWERSRLGTWAAESRFRRVMADGRTFTIEIHTAQRPPDRLVTGFGTVDAQRDGQRLACAPTEDREVLCRPGGPAPPYAEAVAEELRILTTYVRGADALYAVARHENCFHLRLRRRILSPPYGERARFCFTDMGVPFLTEIVRAEATDRTDVNDIRPEVTDADLDPEKWNGGGQG